MLCGGASLVGFASSPARCAACVVPSPRTSGRICSTVQHADGLQTRVSGHVELETIRHEGTARRFTEWRPRYAGWQFVAQERAAIGELGVRPPHHAMRKKLIIAIAIVAAAVPVLLLWPFPRYDPARVHPSIRTLRQPYQRVTADYYLDGGSVGLEIIDRDGQKLQLAIPIYDGPGDTRTYHRLYLGARYFKNTNAVEISFTEDTKRFLAEVIGRNATGPDRDLSLIALRGSPRDYVDVYGRALLNKATGKDKEQGYTLWPW